MDHEIMKIHPANDRSQIHSNLQHAEQMSIENQNPRSSSKMTEVTGRHNVCRVQPTRRWYQNVTKGKDKVRTLDIAPLRKSSPQKRSGMARVLKDLTVLPAHPFTHMFNRRSKWACYS